MIKLLTLLFEVIKGSINSVSVVRENEKVPTLDTENQNAPQTPSFNLQEYIETFNKPEYLVTAQEYFAPSIRSGYPITEPLSKELEENIITLLEAVNKLRIQYGKPMYVTSGIRTTKHNAKIGGARKSSHVSCQAIDFADSDGALKAFATNDNNAMLMLCNLYMESPLDTPTWCHLQTRQTNNRVFGR